MSSPPTTLGQYQIIREIARSNDIVYEAYDPLMNRRVAVKELALPHGSTPQQQEDRISRFKREAQAAGTLNHANIMTVYSFAEDAGRTFMAMEFLDGHTLRNEMDTHGPIPLARAIEITSEVLAGLAHAHQKGVIHRDIKPDNIQILSNGAIKITDFGIARLTFQPNLTIDGQVFGTPSYMSPEQVIGRDIDARSDLFSVGVMLYEMLTGNKPFSGDSVVSTTYAILNKEPDQPPQLSWPVWSAIARSLEKSPAMRFSSAEDMRQALQEALDPSTGAMPLVDPNIPPGYHPSTNPYATAPPLPNYSSSATPPIQAPYNPYGAAPPTANPYAGQYGSQTQQSQGPITFPYNPFQAGGGANAPHTPTFGQPGLPVYFPPPPRLPLFKPETLLFLKRLIIAFLIFGSFFALLVVGFASFAEQLSRASSERKTQQEVTANLDQAKKDIGLNKPAEGELDLRNGLDKDPHNPNILEPLAKLLYGQAQTSNEPNQTAKLFLQSAEAYSDAATYQPDAHQRAVDGQNFAIAAYNACSSAQNTDDDDLKREARQSLENSQAYIQNDPRLSAQVQDMLSRFHI